jgi:hypothetical protein
MFMTNAKLFWTQVHKGEPEIVKHIGNFPDDNPTSFVYELSNIDASTFVAVQITDKGLVTRELTRDEVEFLEKDDHSEQFESEINKGDTI